jgi:hypothetical protein
MVKKTVKKVGAKLPPPVPNLSVLLPVPQQKKRAWSRVVPQGGKSKSKTPESNEQREAFDLYLSMGDERTMERVANSIGRTPLSVKQWGRKHNWVRRVIDHEKQNADTLLIEPHSVQQEKRKFGLKLLDKILRSIVTLNEDGSIATCSVEAKTPSDIRTLLTIREELLNPEKGSKTLGKGSQINAENAVFIIKK